MPRQFGTANQPDRIAKGTTADGKSPLVTQTTYRKFGAQPARITNK